MTPGQGRLFVISAPSGSGKTTVLKTLLQREPNTVRSISMTTRPPRAGERNGRDYWFVGRSRFEKARREGAFLECARILGHGYGTPRRPMEQALRAGKNALLVIDVQGAAQVRRSGLPTTTIFLLPPSFSALRKRLAQRGTETKGQIRDRLDRGRDELAKVSFYDYAVVNDRLEEAVDLLRAILKAERCRVVRTKR